MDKWAELKQMIYDTRENALREEEFSSFGAYSLILEYMALIEAKHSLTKAGY